MSNLKIDNIRKAILQLNDKSGSSPREIQMKLGIVSKKKNQQIKIFTIKSGF